MALAVYGKHPAKGDFLEHAVPPALKPALEGWLDAVLAEARSNLGPAWEQVWRDAPMLRFWVGEAVWGRPVVGVMAASQDRVGRRFPLVMFCTGAEAARVPAPTIGDDGGWYDAMAAHLAARMVQRDLAMAADLVAGAAVPGDLGAPEPGPDAFWAVRPGASVAGLLADIALTDHRRAAAGRSYWWVAGQDALDLNAAVVSQEPVEPVESPGDRGDTPDPEASAAPETVEPDAEDAFDVAGSGWDLPDLADLPEDDGSPFASAAGPSLFAAPEPVDPTARQRADPVAAVPMPLPMPRVLCSQVWAGSGLPSGQVLAWFLRGMTEIG